MLLAALPGQLIDAHSVDGFDFMCDLCVCGGGFVFLHLLGCGDINGFTSLIQTF